MTKLGSSVFARFNPVAVLFEFTRATSIIALCTIAGYMVIGGLLGVILQMAGAKQLVEWIPPAGWCLGGVLGILQVVSRVRRERRQHVQQQHDVVDLIVLDPVFPRMQQRFKQRHFARIIRLPGLFDIRQAFFEADRAHPFPSVGERLVQQQGQE